MTQQQRYDRATDAQQIEHTDSTTSPRGPDIGDDTDADATADDELDVDPEKLTRTADGELIHEETGLVVDENEIDRGPEWRAYDYAESRQKSRVGAPVTETRHDRGLTTDIDWRDADANGRALSADQRKRVQRLRTWQERIRTQNTGERNLQQALSEIDRMASATGLPDSLREVASVIYRRALSEDLLRGRSIEGMATAALLAACRQEGIPRSLDDVTAVSRVHRREIGRCYRYISAELGLALEPVTPGQYVPRFASELELEDRTERKAREIIAETTGQGLHAGKSPTGFAAAAVYLAGIICSDKRTQKAVAEVADVTVVTVRSHYTEQMEALGMAT